MSLTLLIDLDDTLITNSMDSFIPVYLEALGNHLAEHGDPELLIGKLRVATEQMIKNNRPDFTLQKTFDENYFPHIGVDYEILQPAFDDFYSHHFPSLKYLTEPRKEAVTLVQEAFSRGYQVVIATNPLFPESAIYQRLDWGNLSPDSYDYSIVTTYEYFHYAKPNLAYYAEILAQIGWIDSPVVMIGNDFQADIEPARSLGLATYFVENNNGYTKSPSNLGVPFGHGGLDTILDWIDLQSLENLEPQFESPSAINAILHSTAAALDTLTQTITEQTWNVHVRSDEWGPTEILCHLRDVDQEIYLPRIKSLLSEDNPFIEAIDADQWAVERNYKEQDGQKAFHEFMDHRKKILDIILSFEQKDWEKEARHTIFGPTTMLELLRIYARHDRLHIQQIHQALANEKDP
jgi:FMN phosphatase YigB (HAD superfamily)